MTATVLDMRRAVEAVIDAYARDKTEAKLQAAWAALLRFWELAGSAPTAIDEDGDEAYDGQGAHHGICYRLLASFEHVGFVVRDADDEILAGAAYEVLAYLDEGNDERGTVPKHGGVLANGTHFMVDLVEAKVIHSATPIVVEWAQPIRRTEAKIGRNNPCPCGSGRKAKRCGCGTVSL